jgi:lipoate-protein ligase A
LLAPRNLERNRDYAFAGELVILEDEATFDPGKNLRREQYYMRHASAPSLRIWRNSDCIVLGRFLDAGEEVYLDRAERLGVPILKRPSGGGAVFHDLGNVNYSLYLQEETLPAFGLEMSLKGLCFPVINALDEMGVPWEWRPPNSVYVMGKKISGSAQARTGGRVLHHGTLLVETDLDKLRCLLKEGGRSRMAHVVNLVDIVPGISVEEVEAALAAYIKAGDGDVKRARLFKG